MSLELSPSQLIDIAARLEELKVAREDTLRMDWLSADIQRFEDVFLVWRYGTGLRETIDRLRKEVVV